MEDSIPEVEKQRSLPANYVSLSQLRQRWLLKQTHQSQEEQPPKPKPNPIQEDPQNHHKHTPIEKGKKKIQEHSNEVGPKLQINEVGQKKIQQDSNEIGPNLQINEVGQPRNDNVSQKKRRNKWKKGKSMANKTLDTRNEVKKEIEDEKQIGKGIEEEKQITSEENGKKSGVRNGFGRRNRHRNWWVNEMEIVPKFQALSINGEKRTSANFRRDRGGRRNGKESHMIWVVKTDGIHANANAAAETSSGNRARNGGHRFVV